MLHRTIRKLLDDATGISEFIIAVNLDIREFSTFSQKVESPDAAMFIKRVYIKLIDEYFTNVSFFKPTGDGLLLIVPYNEKNLQEVVRGLIDTCFSILKEFGTFCVNDQMINFEVPRRVGIGLSRGTACRLVSKNKILDYSGRILNLATRLMDLARPSGIVFDADFGIELLSNEQVKLFSKENIYIKGIAEREPIEIWYTKDLTRIPSLAKQPLDKIRWQTDTHNWTLGNIKKHATTFIYTLQSEPIDPKEVKVTIKHPAILKGRKQSGYQTTFQFTNFEYVLEAGKPNIEIQFDALAKRLESSGVKKSWPVKLEIIYPKG